MSSKTSKRAAKLAATGFTLLAALYLLAAATTDQAQFPDGYDAVQAGHWRVSWKDPEPMHSIETVEQFNSGKNLRVEIKVPG